jgi:hypothetical protein
MVDAVGTYVRTNDRSLSPHELLHKPIGALIGVDKGAYEALKKLNLITVFDLAVSTLFNSASELLSAGENRNGGLGRYGVPGDLVDDEFRSMPVRELALQPVSVLRAISDDLGREIELSLDIESIRELALWPPFRNSKSILSAAYGGSNGLIQTDPEMPKDLVPAMGQYPTERVQYEVFLFDAFVSDVGPAPIRLGDDGPLDVSAILAGQEGYQKPAIGGVLTYTQSWYTKGLTLGSLIHSTALAPGESTKLAVIDWSRRTFTSASEDISETELLISDVSRSRSINEITTAVARETQQGRSGASNFASASQRGESSGSAGLGNAPALLDLLNPFDGLPLPGVQTSGTSSSSSTSFTNATSWSTSSGERDISASLAQDIVDRTHQESHLARRRRASIVREVSQQESERISTRTVTNYNHMHALTIEYYEVVQLYSAVVELSEAERCLFVPMRPIDFSQPGVIERFKQVISAAGLKSDVRALALTDPNMIALWAPTRIGVWDPPKIEFASRTFGVNVGRPESPFLTFPVAFKFKEVFFPANAPFGSLSVLMASGETIQLFLAPETGDAGGPLFNTLHIAEASRVRAEEVFSARLRDVRRVTAHKKDDSRDFEGDINVSLFESSVPPLGDGPWFMLSWTARVSKADTSVVVLLFQPTPSTGSLIQHLMENRLYYSQQVWRSLDSASIGFLLAGYALEEDGRAKSLTELVDPTPAAVIANYLAFRMSGGSATKRNEWMERKKIRVGTVREDIIPVPSGGVFAEAVLGRFNSAEKLDISRFWNWQDSPIPFQAPEIAAIQASSRRDADTTTPGQISAPVLSVVNPPALPDPQGMVSILAAIQNGNLFRDMSGLAATIGLAQAGLTSAQQGASAAGQQAGQNAAVAAQLGAKVAELAAKLVAAYFTGGASLAAGAGAEGLAGLAGGISGQGAKINKGRELDERGVSVQTPGGGAPSDGVGDGGSGSAEGAGGGSGGGAPTGTNGSNEAAAFNASLGGGVSSIPRLIEQLVLGSTGSGQAGTGGSGSGRPASPPLEAEIAKTPRLQQAYDFMRSRGWSLQRKDLGSGNFAEVDVGSRVAYIDDLDVTPETAVQWAKEALLSAYREDEDLRLSATLNQARAIFADPAALELEKMARVFEWAQFHWGGNLSALLRDMLIVLADGTPRVPSRPLQSQYYLWRGMGVTSQPDSTGFKRPYRQSGNQVRHATGSLYTCFVYRQAGYEAAQFRETEPSDRRLNLACLNIANKLHEGGALWAPENIGKILLRELGDPAEKKPWMGADPPSPAPP